MLACRLAEPARKMIGLESAEVAAQELALEFQATARVLHAAHQHGNKFSGQKNGHAYANAIIPSGLANRLEVGQRVRLDYLAHRTAVHQRRRAFALNRP
jgi:hypothetical protein